MSGNDQDLMEELKQNDILSDDQAESDRPPYQRPTSPNKEDQEVYYEEVEGQF
jgi:hypothetical protein